MERWLALEGITHAFGTMRVLDGLTLAVRRGERHALIGPNGTGKTTVLNVIGGWLRPQAGEVWFQGHAITDWPAHRIARLGIARAAQIPQTFPGLTVRDHLRAALHPGGWRFAAELEGRVREAAARVGLEPLLETRAAELAHGDQKRLELATALAQRPRLLLLDEPTAGLSAAETQTVIKALRATPVTLLVVEHDMAVVAALADRVSVLYRGRVLAQGPPERIARDERVQAIYLRGHVAR